MTDITFTISNVIMQGGSTPPVIPAADPVYIRAVGTTLSWGYDPGQLYSNVAKIAMIGDSQGVGIGESSGHKPQDLLHARYGAATITNYCVSGQNSRTIMPDGSNQYVNAVGNITKALADGNRVIIVFDTSNDSNPNDLHGGRVPLAEWKANLQIIYDAAIAGGAHLLCFVSTIPRGDLDTTGKQQQQALRDWLVATYPNRVAQCWFALVDPATGDTLLSAFDSGDLIHLNDAGGLIMTNSVIALLDYHFSTLASTVIKTELQKSSAAEGTYALDSTQHGYTAIGAPGYFYKAKVYYIDGSMALSDNYAAVGAAPLTVNAGQDQSIPQGTNTGFLSGTATPSTGATITGYTWSQVSGPTVSFGTPNAATTTFTGAVAGAFVFRLTATDSAGQSAHDDVAVTIAASGGGTGPAKYHFAKTSAGITPVDGYNVVLGGGLDPANYGASWPDTAGTSGLTLHHVVTDSASALAKWGEDFAGTGNVGDDNGETIDDGGGMQPAPGVQRSGQWNKGVVNPGEQFYVSGGAPDQLCDVYGYGSLKASFSLDASPMVFSAGGSTAQFNATGATSQFGKVTVPFDENGQIRNIYFAPVAGQSEFGMANALIFVPRTV